MDWKDSGCLLLDENGVSTDVATLQCIPVVFGNILNTALIFAGGVALVFIIISGYKFINSGGDPKQVEGARKTATYAILGLLLILFSFAIVNFIAYFTGAECIKTFAFDSCATTTTTP